MRVDIIVKLVFVSGMKREWLPGSDKVSYLWRFVMGQNVKRGLAEAEKISGEGFAGGKGHMDVAVVLGRDPDIPDIKGNDDFASNMLFCNWCNLAEGAICGSHPHVTNEEYYYVIKGRGRMEIKHPDGN
jgi:hypothetical protein